jgi:hypothetical protein
MKRFMMVVLAGLALVTPVVAGEAPEQYCVRVVADADKGKAQMFEAGLLYYHGMYMGKQCVKVDYVRAFELLRKAGAASDFQSLLTNLTEKANAGNPKAKAALEKMDRLGWIEKVPE